MYTPNQNAATPAIPHIPVLLGPVVEDLALEGADRFLDCTVGLGGHASEALTKNSEMQLCGLDRDAEALQIAKERLSPFGNRFHLFHLEFAEFPIALAELGWNNVDRCLLDLGVSSLQLDEGTRGFSFRHDGPLDMRMDQASGNKKAWDIVNRGNFAELRDCFAIMGEDPQAGRIARAIITSRERSPINNTLELARIISSAYPPAWRRSARRHPATRCFQALRMLVNDELGQLKRFLDNIWDYLSPGGRLAIISFQSLEDRIVKHAFRAWAARGAGEILHKKPVVADEEEVSFNPRASSAKLRAIIKTGMSL